MTNDQNNDEVELAVCSECGADAKLILLAVQPEEWYVRCGGPDECKSGPLCDTSKEAKAEWGVVL